MEDRVGENRSLKNRYLLSILTILIVATTSSCSGLLKRRNQMEQDQTANTQGEFVSKAQYESLLKKYEGLLARNQELEKGGASGSASLKEMDLSKTVDPFSEQAPKIAENISSGPKMEEIPTTMKSIPNPSQREILQLQKIKNLIVSDQTDEALKMIKDLERSENIQIQVRNKFLFGEALYKQGEYDLALQMYEDILSKYAFSGFVIKSLNRLIDCSRQLKLKQKEDKYQSMLTDIFESA